MAEPADKARFSFGKLQSNICVFLRHTGQIRECDVVMSTIITIIGNEPHNSSLPSKRASILSDIYAVKGVLTDMFSVSRRRESLEFRLEFLRLRKDENALSAEVTIEDRIRLGNASSDLTSAYILRNEHAKAREIM